MPQISFSELNELIGSAGIGSVAILGFALFLDAISPLYELVEGNAGTQTWTFFVVVPLFVFSYVAGVLCVAMGSLLRSLWENNAVSSLDFRAIDDKLLGLVTVEYRAHRRKLDILEGSVSAFTLLAFGLIWDSFAFGLPLFGAITAIVSLSASMLCLLIARRETRVFRDFMTGITKARA